MKDSAAKQSSLLLIEGNPADAAFISLFLKELNVPNELTIAKDGQVALDLLFGPEASYCPDLIVLGRALPRVGPREVLLAIQAGERTRRIPVLLIGSEYDGRQNQMPPGMTYAGRMMNLDDYLHLCRQLASMLKP